MSDTILSTVAARFNGLPPAGGPTDRLMAISTREGEGMTVDESTRREAGEDELTEPSPVIESNISTQGSSVS